jgi:hypothetical protein
MQKKKQFLVKFRIFEKFVKSYKQCITRSVYKCAHYIRVINFTRLASLVYKLPPRE